MKTGSIGCIVLFLLAGAFAQDVDRQSTTVVQNAKQPILWTQKIENSAQDSAKPVHYFIIRPDGEISELPETFCSYIRAYRVRRKSQGSDEVTPAGYTTCVPGTRFELRSAVQRLPREPK